jgi:aerobic-type carbon monoxide dehydrogenase small subunit (CoxS/CutS family)
MAALEGEERQRENRWRRVKAMNKALHDAVDTRNTLFGCSQGEAGEVLIEWDGEQ